MAFIPTTVAQNWTLDTASQIGILKLEPQKGEWEMANFKVGDRVRSAKERDFLDHWTVWWEKQEGPVKDGVFVIVKDLGGGDYQYSNRIDGDGPQSHSDFLELVEDTPMPTPEYSCIRVVPPSKPKREIVSNEVRFNCGASFDISDGGDNDVRIEVGGSFFTPKALREAAALFTTLAEVLEENSNA